MNRVIQTEVMAGNGEPIPVWLARVGVSDTLYADCAGNLFGKQEIVAEERAELVPYDASGVGYQALEWSGNSVSGFYASNAGLIQRATAKAAEAQKASPLELIN